MAWHGLVGRAGRALLFVLALGAPLVVAVPPSGAAGVTITPIRQIGSAGHADLYGWGMATETDGSVLVGDYWNYRVVHYAKDGTFLGTVVPRAATHLAPYGIAVDPTNGDLYFGDVDSGATVDKYTAGGAFLLSFGSEGTGNGQFSGGGRDVTVDGDGNVWVGDMPNFRAQKFAPDGRFLLAVPDPAVPPPPGGFAEPRAVGVDSAGNVFVSDTDNWRIEKFDAAGQFTL